MTPFNQYAQYYDDMYQGKDYVKETELIKNVFIRLSPRPVASILSLGCGTGTYEILLAKQGYQLTGIDFSPQMLKIAQSKIKAARVESQIKLVESDIRHFPKLGNKFDAAIMMFNIAGYLHTPADLTAVAKNVANHLKTGGIFLFDAWYGPAVVADPPGNRAKTLIKDGVTITRVTKGSLDKKNKLVKIIFEVTETIDNKITKNVTEDHPMRYWDLDVIKTALKAGGLKLIKTTAFDNLDAPVSSAHWDMQVICQKL
jgi:SAM-dependent methyltransferase